MNKTKESILNLFQDFCNQISIDEVAGNPPVLKNLADLEIEILLLKSLNLDLVNVGKE